MTQEEATNYYNERARDYHEAAAGDPMFTPEVRHWHAEIFRKLAGFA